MLKKKLILLFFPVFLLFAFFIFQKPEKLPVPQPFNIIAYYNGNAENIVNYPIEKLDQIIFSFCHLKGDRLSVDDEGDSLTIRKLVELKKKVNPKLKILLALGGWGGCETCSNVFLTEKGRKEFALSAKGLQEEYGTDGIDLDWEYPAIAGFPDHAFTKEDAANFTLLVKELRNVLGNKTEISFAAGAFEHFFENSVEWEKVMPLVNRVNLMTYDFYTGGSPITGHHTQLYSNINQKRSADYTVRYLDSIGVPKNKMVIGAAFYGRAWKNMGNINNGLYQKGEYLRSINYKNMDDFFSENRTLEKKWDKDSHAPYAYDSVNKIFLSYDNIQSVKEKTKYAKRAGLDGIMFWQLGGDKNKDGLLDVIHEAKYSNN